MKNIVVLTLLFINISVHSQTIKLYPKYLSLQVKDSFQFCINNNVPVIWKVDNSNFKITPEGKLYIDSLPTKKRVAKVFVQSIEGGSIDSCEVTAVSWVTQRSKLVINEILPWHGILGKIKNEVFFSYSYDLLKTPDGFKTKTFIGNLPDFPSNYNLLVTPYGSFYRSNSKIYFSKDLKHWSLTFQGNFIGLHHSFDYYYDIKDSLVYVYFGEYSWDKPTNEHRVYRGTIKADGSSKWETILKFNSRSSFNTTPMIRPIARHIHVVKVDPYTGYVWIGTGDDGHEPMILYSNDHGTTFNTLGMGTQEYRALSIWFTEKYIYWNMDSYAPQKIFRIPKNAFNEQGICPSLSPELDHGYTKIGRKYYVVKNTDPGYFPGSYFIETKERNLDSDHIVISCNDPNFNYKEVVADLACGSMWFTCNAKSKTGDDVVIMGVAGSANYYDTRNRVFGIKENKDGTVNVQELLTLPSYNDEYEQLEPLLQDHNGFIYFHARSKNGEIYKTTLEWVDSTESNITECINYNFDSSPYLIYPNPNNGTFKIHKKYGFNNSMKYVFEFFDSSGQVIYKQAIVDPGFEFNMEESFNIPFIKKGVYFARVFYDQKVDYIGMFVVH